MAHAYAIIHPNPRLRKDYIEKELEKERIHSIDRLDYSTYEKIGIEDVRHLITFLQLKPYASKLKAVILEGKILTPEAQQALLKTFEEPPQNSILYIGTHSEDSLIPTLLSRCQVIKLTQTESKDNTHSSLQTFWSTLLVTHPVRRLTLTQELTKDRTQLEKWLTEQIIFLRSVLFSLYTPDPLLHTSPKKLVRLIKSTQLAHERTRSNIATKLVLDHLFLEIPYTPAAST